MADRIFEGASIVVPAGSLRGTVLAGRLRQVLLSYRDGTRMVAGACSTESNTILFGNTARRACGPGSGYFRRLGDQVAVAAFDADPGERFAYGLLLIINRIRHELVRIRTT